MSDSNPVESSLASVFAQTHVKAAIEHYIAATDEFQKENWESCILKGGKFIEAVLKVLYIYAGFTLPPARRFKVNEILKDLKNLQQGTYSDSIRLTIPRACEFAYDIASNRGARHDPYEVDPNEMDATVMIAGISWILAELVRFSQKGTVDQSAVKERIQGIIQRRFPTIETVDGRTYFHIPNISGRIVALLALWHQHPKRMSRGELISVIERHGFTTQNAYTSLKRISNLVDIDADGNYRVLKPGLIEAERVIGSIK